MQRLKSYLFLILCVVLVLGALFVFLNMTGCKAGWNDPVPPKPTPDNPCGERWFSCGNKMCCPEYHVCRPGYCAYVGGPGPTWGSSRDGGPPERMPLLTEDEARSIRR